MLSQQGRSSLEAALRPFISDTVLVATCPTMRPGVVSGEVANRLTNRRPRYWDSEWGDPTQLPESDREFIV